MLGGMPEALCRQIIGNNVSIEEMRDLFKYVIKVNFLILRRWKTSKSLSELKPQPNSYYLTSSTLPKTCTWRQCLRNLFRRLPASWGSWASTTSTPFKGVGNQRQEALITRRLPKYRIGLEERLTNSRLKNRLNWL